MRKLILGALLGLSAAGQTKIDLATQAKSVDFSAASSTKPLKTGAALPSTCSVGEVFFLSTGTPGANLYACTAANTWSAQGGLTSQDCWYDPDDQTLKCRDAGGNVYAAVKTAATATPNQWIDYIGADGIPHTSRPTAAAVGAVADPGAAGIPYRTGSGTATPATADHLSSPFACEDSGAVNAYACALNPSIAAYRAGVTYWFKAKNANTGSATFNLNGLGAKPILKNATQQLAAGDIKAGQWVIVTYDGTAMQMQSQTGNPGSGAVSSVFGRTGPITAQSGDYTTAQVTESGNLYFTNARAQQAFSYPGALRLSGGALDCPTCITTSTQADTDLYGSFPHLSVGKLRGRLVANTAPADRQYLGWNAAASQWEPKTPPVSSVFGRSGAVTATAGDYSFSQISGAAAVSQLPATVMRSDANNTITAGTQDLSGADHTLPMKSGLLADLPGDCATGEAYFATDAPAGNNVYGCTADNTWSAQGVSLSIASEGTEIGSRPKMNFTTGPGLISLMSDMGSEIDILWALDTAVVQTQSGEQSGGALLCASNGGSDRNYQCSMTPALSAYATGMTLHWKPDVNGAGGETTLNIDTLGAAPVKLRDGISDPGAGDVVAGQLYPIWYDGAAFRLMAYSSGEAGGAVSSVFGREGAVIGQAGDYSTDQVTEGANLYFTEERARAAVAWETLADKPAAYAPSSHAATHQSGGSDEIATAVPAPNAIPKAGANGQLDPGWIPAAAGGATGQSKVLIFDGSTTILADGSTVVWTCGTGSGAQCTANWTVPGGVNWVTVEMWSGGAGGGGSIAGSSSGSGGGGGAYLKIPCAVTPGGTLAIAVGSGGPGGAAGGGYTTAGGASSIVCDGDAITAYGAIPYLYNAVSAGVPGSLWATAPYGPFVRAADGASVGISASSPYCGGNAAAGYSAGTLNLGACAGAGRTSSGAGTAGGRAQGGGGGGGGGSYDNALTGTGGISTLGGAGGNGGAWTAGSGYASCGPGSVPGGGGGGAAAETTGGNDHAGCAGGRGEVRIYYIK